jgi:hypothetical protein
LLGVLVMPLPQPHRAKVFRFFYKKRTAFFAYVVALPEPAEAA